MMMVVALTLILVHTVDPLLTRLVYRVQLVNGVNLSRDQKGKENEDKMEIATAASHVCAQKCSKVTEM